MDQIYPIKIKVKLTPIYFDRVPTISFGINGAREQMSLSTEKWVEFEYSTTAKTGYFEVEMTGKTNQDTDLINNKDTAIVIEEVTFDELTSPKFAWAGIYTPNYPTHIQGEPQLSPCTYLGWNGTWRLDYTLPIYTWIHKVEELGWIYD